MTESEEQGVDGLRVRVFVIGREYKVPQGLTIMKAMEYAGYQFIRGAGCRGGFCGACGTVYRLENDYKLKFGLACQTTVEDGMYLAVLPFTPAEKAIYDIEKLHPSKTVLLEYYPEIAKCVSCNTCSKACPQELKVMDFVQAALKGDIEKVAHLSFDCIQCGLCAMRCPVGIVPYHIAQLARRLYARYISKPSPIVLLRIKELKEGKFDSEFEKLLSMKLEELKQLYEKVEMEE